MAYVKRVRQLRVAPKNGTIARKLWDFLERGDQPTAEEITELLYGKYTFENYIRIGSAVNACRTYYKRNGKLLYMVPIEGKRRLKVLDKAEEIADRVPIDSTRAKTGYRNMLFSTGVLQKDFSKDIAHINDAKHVLLELQQFIIGEEIKLLSKPK